MLCRVGLVLEYCWLFLVTSERVADR